MSDEAVHELLAHSLAAWGAAGVVGRDGGAFVVDAGLHAIRVERAPPDLPLRWTVTVDGRRRGAVSLVAVLRQVRSALEPGYARNRVRIAVAPLVPQ
ncbi:MAG: hypothetical protein IT538_07475 [Variibacter sp.]|nr:hypothetical protein [Variibacter sp.]